MKEMQGSYPEAVNLLKLHENKSLCLYILTFPLERICSFHYFSSYVKLLRATGRVIVKFRDERKGVKKSAHHVSATVLGSQDVKMSKT